MFTFPENWSEMTAEEQQQWVIDQVTAELEAKTSGLKKSQQTILSEKKTLGEKIKAFEALGMSPEEIQEALEDREKMRNDDLWKKGKVDELAKKEVEKVRAELSAQVKAAVEKGDASEKEASALRSELAKTKISGAIVNAVNESGLVPNKGQLQILQMLGQQEITYDSESGEIILKEGDNPRFNAKTGKPMTVADWVFEKKENIKGLFDETKPGGSGARNGDPSGQKNENMTSTQKIASGLKELGA